MQNVALWSLLLGAALMAGGCATESVGDRQAGTAAAPSTAVTETAASNTTAIDAVAPDAEAAQATAGIQNDPATASKDDPIVCRIENQLGTRIGKQVCRRRSDIAKQTEQAEATMKDIDRKSGTGVGGESLPTG